MSNRVFIKSGHGHMPGPAIVHIRDGSTVLVSRTNIHPGHRFWIRAGALEEYAPDEERERIIAAAINFGAVISLPRPARHHTIIQTMDTEMGINGVLATPQTQGFITDTGRFVNRVEAYYLAYTAGQIINGSKGPQLYSEDLW